MTDSGRSERSNLSTDAASSAPPPASSPAVRSVMRANRARDTRPEVAIRSAMHRCGLRFLKHRRPLPELRCVADAVFPTERVAVFVDGCYWHRCGEHGTQPRTNSAYWAAKLDGNVTRDRRNDAALGAAGWLTLRIWNTRHRAQRPLGLRPSCRIGEPEAAAPRRSQIRCAKGFAVVCSNLVGMATFDEAAWRADTAWQGTAPSHAEMWAVLNDPSVASDFCAAVAARVGRSELLATASLHALRAAGISGSALLDEYRRVSGRQVRQATIDRLLKAPLTRRARWNNSFANLVSGRFTELVFEATYSTPLREVGVVVEDATTDRSFVDYRLVAADNDESFALSINVKNAGRQMRLARTFFGLDPEDTLPMATYKAFGAADADIPPLLYVYLVDWTLLERLREAYWLRSLSAGEQEVFRLMTTFQGFPRDLEDEFVASTVERRLDRLLAEVGYTESSDLPFRVIQPHAATRSSTNTTSGVRTCSSRGWRPIPTCISASSTKRSRFMN